MKKIIYILLATTLVVAHSFSSFAASAEEKSLLDKGTVIEGIYFKAEEEIETKPEDVLPETIFKIETAAGIQNISAKVYKEEAEKLIKLVNEERVRAGLKAYIVEDKFLQASQLRAVELSLSFSHNRPNGTLALTATKGLNGENIAKNQKTAEELMDAFMNSPGHRKNILHKKFKKINVGAVEVDGNIYWVQLFGV